MKKILDYNIIEKTRETRFAINYRCRRDGSQETYILKLYKIKNPTLSEIARFKQEFERIKNARIDGVIMINDIIDVKNELGIVLEDISGISLSETMENKKDPD